MSRLAIGVDLGGTELRAALVNAEGLLLEHVREPTRAADGVSAVVEQIVALVMRVRARCPDAHLEGIGIGSPGPLNASAGIVRQAPMLKGWHDVPLSRLLAEGTGLPCLLENDANVAALAEWRFGAGRGCSNLVYVTLSTGIGGGVIVDGRLLSGRDGLAGEIGHMRITERPIACRCGATGCWEAMASGTALADFAAARLAERDATTLAVTAGRVTAQDVVAHAARGDAVARRLMEDEARYLGIGFTNLLHLFSPEAIIVGGGLAQALEAFRPGFESVRSRCAMAAYREIPIVTAKLGGHAGIIGAASLCFERPPARLAAR